MSEDIALYHKFPKLRELPRIALANFPTPVQKLPKTSEKLEGCNVWVKRDDLCSPKYGGNKPRKYEFILADTIKQKKETIVTIGGTGSNHVLANTIYAKDLGLKSDIYLFDQPLTEHVRHNLLCDLFHGATMHYTGGYIKTGLLVIWKLLKDRKSYLIMPGASIPLGTVGYVNAGLELAEQVKKGEMPEPDQLFVAVGSTGTCAGLTLGLELAGLKTKIQGISVSMKMITSKNSVLKLAKNTLKLLRKIDPSIPDVSSKMENRLSVSHDFLGGEYGRVTYEGQEAVNIVKEDGITLDFTYTGKTFSGLIAHCRENRCAKDEVILFWNTYNSVDLSSQYCNVDYKTLPSSLHKFFDGSVPLDEKPVYARKRA